MLILLLVHLCLWLSEHLIKIVSVWVQTLADFLAHGSDNYKFNQSFLVMCVVLGTLMLYLWTLCLWLSEYLIKIVPVWVQTSTDFGYKHQLTFLRMEVTSTYQSNLNLIMSMVQWQSNFNPVYFMSVVVRVSYQNCICLGIIISWIIAHGSGLYIPQQTILS